MGEEANIPQEPKPENIVELSDQPSNANILEEKQRKQRGGKRPGAGRKKVYASDKERKLAWYHAHKEELMKRRKSGQKGTRRKKDGTGEQSESPTPENTDNLKRAILEEMDSGSVQSNGNNQITTIEVVQTSEMPVEVTVVQQVMENPQLIEALKLGTDQTNDETAAAVAAVAAVQHMIEQEQILQQQMQQSVS